MLLQQEARAAHIGILKLKVLMDDYCVSLLV